MNNLTQSFAILIAFFALNFHTGCDSTEITDSTVSVMFSLSSITQKISNDAIQLDTIKILLRDIKIKNQSGNNEQNLRIKPLFVYLNLNGASTDFAVGSVPPGSYDRICFRIHTPGDSETPPDPEFKNGNLRYSVIVKGLFNSEPFIYKSRKSAYKDLKLEEPVQVDENETVNLTITINPIGWFYKNDVLLDPGDPSNEIEIDNNIKYSFEKCFRDDDKG